MARKVTDENATVVLSKRDYLQLIEEHILLNALLKAGLEKLPLYKCAKEILKSGHVEIHIEPISKNYR